MKHLCLISCLLILCGCAGRVRHSYEVESALQSLDQVISNKEMIEGQKENPGNFLLMHAMGPNVAGVIGSAVAAGVLLAIYG